MLMIAKLWANPSLPPCDPRISQNRLDGPAGPDATPFQQFGSTGSAPDFFLQVQP
jgi:hypothetical protein